MKTVLRLFLSETRCMGGIDCHKTGMSVGESFVHKAVKCSKIAGHPKDVPPKVSSQDYELTRYYFCLECMKISKYNTNKT